MIGYMTQALLVPTPRSPQRIIIFPKFEIASTSQFPLKMLRFMFSCFVVILVVLKFGASTSPEEVPIKLVHKQYRSVVSYLKLAIADEWASKIEDQDIARWFKENHIDHLYNGKNFLHVALDFNLEDMIQDLLVRGADPNVVDSNGNTALHLATAQPKSSDDVFRNIFEARCSSLTRPFMKVLANVGIKIPEIVNVRNDNRETALHVAVSNNVNWRIKDLLNMGASRTMTCHGQTALELAKQKLKDCESQGLDSGLAQYLVDQFEN